MDPRAPGAPGLAAVAGESLTADAGERRLIEALLRRDRKAAATFVAAHIDAVYSYARHRLAPRADLVDDVVQDVFVAAFHQLPTFQGQSSLRTWVIAIARHKVNDIYRQRLRTSRVFDDLSVGGDDPAAEAAPVDEEIDRARAREKTQRVLARLPERYSLLLLWRYWEQRSVREMATATGTTEKGVERALARARARFKQLWLQE